MRAKLGADIVYPAAALPVAASLPDTASVLAAHAALMRDTEASKRIASGDLPYVSLSAPGAAESARETLASLVALAAWFEEAAGAGANGWVITAYQLLLEARVADPAAKEALGRLCAEWAAIAAEGNLLGLKGIEVAVAPGDAAFDAAVEKLAHGGKPFGLFGGGALKEQLAAVRVAGAALAVKPPALEWKDVHAWRGWQHRAAGFPGRWNACARMLSLPELPAYGTNAIAALLRVGGLVQRIHGFQSEAPRLLAAVAALFSHGVDAREVIVARQVRRHPPGAGRCSEPRRP